MLARTQENITTSGGDDAGAALERNRSLHITRHVSKNVLPLLEKLESDTDVTSNLNVVVLGRDLSEELVEVADGGSDLLFVTSVDADYK